MQVESCRFATWNSAPAKLSAAAFFADEAEVELFRDRAARAKRWLQTIHKEIEEKLIAPRSASHTEQTLP